MSKNVSAKYYQEERLQKKLVKEIKKKNKKNDSIVSEDEKQKLVEYRRNIKWEKNLFL